jgi:phosphoglycerate kinase
MIDYYTITKPYWLINPASQVKGPSLLRVDINVPVINGRIVEDNLRLKVYSEIISLLAEHSGVVVVSHQGRKGTESFISLRQHWIVLRKALPSDIDIDFVPYHELFSRDTRERIRNLGSREVLLIDNIRMMREEKNFNATDSQFIRFFRGIIGTCINDAMPVWHRAHTSVMALPYIAPTLIGMRAIFELKTLREALESKKSEAGIVMGGAKLAKTNYLVKILEKMDGFTGGLPGQLIARLKGYDLGEKNNRFIENRFSPDMIDAARVLIKKFNIHHPMDFIVRENDENREVKLEDLKGTKGYIMDVGPETVEKYAEALQTKSTRIRAGPLGVYEKGYTNGIELTKRIIGVGLIFLGGDTAEEVVMYGLDKAIYSSGGLICLSGGAFLHGLAGKRYPSIDILIEKEMSKNY